MVNLSIIIVSYNTKQLIKNCIESILIITKLTQYEIIIVDNDSKDGSIEMIKARFPNIILIENKKNLGFGKANNQGMKIAKGRFFLLLNSDTLIKDNAIEKMIDFMDKNPQIGMLSPKLLNDDGSIQPSVSTLPNLWFVFLRMFRLRKLFPMEFLKRLALNNLFGATVKSYFQSETEKPLEVDFVSGACMLIRREVIEQVGIFDENFFMYVEDFDLCKRIKEKGWKIYYYPEAEIIHFGGKSSEGFRDLSTASYQSLYYYFRKHHGRLEEFAVKYIVMAALLTRGCMNVILNPIKTIRGDNKILKDYLKIIRITVSEKL